MNYEQMLKELEQIPMFGNAAGLSNLSAYLEYLGHPEESFRVIHVAGTNGKGSVCAFMESVLREAGYHTGLFTSPHLVHVNERIRLDFAACSEEKMAEAYTKVKKLIENRESLGLKMLTYFEVLFLLAMLVFEKEKPDYCIIETGLGGRLDATVLTKPVLSVITSISLDHTAILGDSIEEIAAEKAGILKKDVPAVVFRENERAYQVIEQIAQQIGAPIYPVYPSDAHIFEKNVNYIDFSYKNRYYKNDMLRVNTFALYQVYNACLAATALHLADDLISDDEMARGILGMSWEGRMEQLLPGIFVDGAHNPGAMERIRQTMQGISKDWTLLFAVCQDKDYQAMIDILSKTAWKKIIVVHFQGSRAAAVGAIAEEFKKRVSCEVVSLNDVPEAIKQIRQMNETPALCLGSLYLVGEIKSICKRLT